jgi:hypothetical protein
MASGCRRQLGWTYYSKGQWYLDAKKQLGWTFCSQGQWHLDAEDNLAGLIVDKDNGIWVQTITWLDLL